jgi:hypothetical protein
MSQENVEAVREAYARYNAGERTPSVEYMDKREALEAAGLSE